MSSNSLKFQCDLDDHEHGPNCGHKAIKVGIHNCFDFSRPMSLFLFFFSFPSYPFFCSFFFFYLHHTHRFVRSPFILISTATITDFSTMVTSIAASSAQLPLGGFPLKSISSTMTRTSPFVPFRLIHVLSRSSAAPSTKLRVSCVTIRTTPLVVMNVFVTETTLTISLATSSTTLQMANVPFTVKLKCSTTGTPLIPSSSGRYFCTISLCILRMFHLLLFILCSAILSLSLSLSHCDENGRTDAVSHPPSAFSTVAARCVKLHTTHYPLIVVHGTKTRTPCVSLRCFS